MPVSCPDSYRPVQKYEPKNCDLLNLKLGPSVYSGFNMVALKDQPNEKKPLLKGAISNIYFTWIPKDLCVYAQFRNITFPTEQTQEFVCSINFIDTNAVFCVNSTRCDEIRTGCHPSVNLYVTRQSYSFSFIGGIVTETVWIGS